MIKIGDWVTQYSAGYWQVLDIVPKYADEDSESCKKGDRIGQWVILKKGFTPKMKPANACEFVDGQWCKPVSAEVAAAIEAAFAENPKAKQKFDSAPDMPKPAVNSTWMTLSGEESTAFSALLARMPQRFTLEQFWSQTSDYRRCVTDPSGASHILYLYSYLWEIDEHFDPLHFGPELKQL